MEADGEEEEEADSGQQRRNETNVTGLEFEIDNAISQPEAPEDIKSTAENLSVKHEIWRPKYHARSAVTGVSERSIVQHSSGIQFFLLNAIRKTHVSLPLQI